MSDDSAIGPFDVFLDESGNTGINLADPDQPGFIVGGWMVQRSAAEEAEAAVREINIPGSRAEIKSSILGARRHHSAVAAVFDQLLHLACRPTFFIFDKQYAIAAKIIEGFLDPLYNSTVTYGFELDTERKQLYANQLCKLPINRIADVWAAMTKGDEAAVGATLFQLCRTLHLATFDELASLLEGAFPNTGPVAMVHSQPGGDPIWRHGQGLPVPALADLFGYYETIAEAHGVTGVGIFHDATRQFAPVISEYFAHLKAAAPQELWIGEGFLRVGYAALDDVHFVDSRTSPLVQAADLLCGALALVTKVEDHSEVDEPLVWILGGIQTALFEGPPSPCGIAASDEFLGKALWPFHVFAKEVDGTA